ncbi:MAG: hypothetical protein HOY71_17590 [Nonomuraea sp.]|nr:hypothetical protein [Nonomuraea sp.]
MNVTLTDRYVAAVARRLPDRQRREIALELRASIGDEVEARIAVGEGTAQAEHAVLRDLGDPARLAAGYARHPLALVGPDSYPAYVRALRVSCATVLPVVYVVLALVFRAEGAGAWAALSRPLGITLTVAMYLLVAVTGLFALADRRPGARADPWTPDELVVHDVRQGPWTDAIGEVVIAVAVVAALFLQRAVAPVPVVDPALWGFWIPYLVAAVALAVAVRLVRLRTRHPATAVAATAVTLAGAVPLAWLFWQARFLNPALVHHDPGGWVAWLALLVVAVLSVGAILVTWRNTLAAGTEER